MSKFQIVLLGIFGLLIIGSVIVFSKYRSSSENMVSLSVWGTMPDVEFQDAISKTSLFNSKLYKLSYELKSPENIYNEFVEAIASGESPDLIFLPHEKIVEEKNKIFLLPYSAYSERDFKDAFIEGTEVFLSPEGIVALPIVVDPLVMYWNRSLFTLGKVTEPPRFWDEFYSLTQAISKKDNALNITRSAAALGEYANVSNAKEIISNLMIQAGTPIVDTRGVKPRSALADALSPDCSIPPSEAAVNFYTQFGNPAKPFYSWNRSLPKSDSYFLSGNLGIYFGFASELFAIQSKNPNLNFDVAEVPVSRTDATDDGKCLKNISFAKFTGLAISKGSKNAQAAFQVAAILSSKEGAKAFSDALSLPPVRRDILKDKPLDPYKEVFYNSAIRSKAWLDPNPEETDKIFQDMIESITSGRERVSAAVARASKALGDLFK